MHEGADKPLGRRRYGNNYVLIDEGISILFAEFPDDFAYRRPLLDSMRQRVYIAPFGLWLTLDAGTFTSLEVNKKTRAVRVTLSASTANVQIARLRIEQPAKVSGVGAFRPQKQEKVERGAYAVALGKTVKQIELVEKK